MGEKTASTLCYLSFIPWFIALLSFEGSPVVAYNLVQGFFVSILLALPTCVTQIIGIIYALIAIIHINRDEECPYLFLADSLAYKLSYNEKFLDFLYNFKLAFAIALFVIAFGLVFGIILLLYIFNLI